MSGALRDAIVGSTNLYRGRAYDFVELTLQQPDGSTRPRPIVRHRGAAVIVALLDDGSGVPRVVCVRNDRHTINDRLLELPAGGIDPGESPDQTAARELREETGYTAATITEVGRFYTTPGLTDELMHAYVATGLTMAEQDLQDDESLTVERIPLDELLAMVDTGTLMDGKSILALLLARRKGLLDR